MVCDFTISSPICEIEGGKGLYLGISMNENVTRKKYIYDFQKQIWQFQYVVDSSNVWDTYFIYEYKSPILNHFTSYILGSAVDINIVPPAFCTNNNYSVYCCQLAEEEENIHFEARYNSNYSDFTINISNPNIYKLPSAYINENSHSCKLGNNYIACNNIIEY